MFRNAAPVVEPAPAVTADESLVPLSHLALDLGGEPDGGWALYLGRRGIAIVPDSLGRDSVDHGAARRLLDEQREHVVRKSKHLAALEAEAIERDRLKFAGIWKGVAATALPDGVSAGDAMLQAARDSRPKRQSVLEESLSNSPEMSYHAFTAHPDEE